MPQSHRWRIRELAGPSQISEHVQCKVMDFCRFISRFLAVFLIAGVVSQPLAAPAAAKRLSVVEMTDVSAMSADMLCCPDQPNKNGCKECPLSSCVLQLIQDQPPHADGVVVRLATSTVLRSLNDLVADGLIRAPPDHPPRTLT
jgi:hypothetical protein